jgi:hypothetical protein
MSSAQATVEVFWTAYQTLSLKERTKLLKKIMENDSAYEDLVESRDAESRKVALLFLGKNTRLTGKPAVQS